MNYETFRRTWEAALRDSRLPTMGMGPSELLNVTHLCRSYSLRVEPFGGQDSEPFFVTAHLSWSWDALDTARTATTEGDFLTEVLGRELAHKVKSEPRRLRVDVELSATLTWGHPLPMPSSKAWASWAEETLLRLQDIERLLPNETFIENDDGRVQEVLAWQSSPTAGVICDPDGTLKLSGVSIAAGEVIRVPRIWQDAEREADDHPRPQLDDLFKRVKASLMAWSQSLDHLRKR